MMDKETNIKWMKIAEEVLQDSNKQWKLFKDKKKKTTIYKGYNGQISAFGVSVLMLGLKPTVAVYYQDKPNQQGAADQEKAHRYVLLEVIVEMLRKETYWANEFDSLEKLVRGVLGSDENQEKGKRLKNDLLNCSIALKQVIRTYKLEK